MLIVNEKEYPIKMYGYIDDGKILFEFIGKTKEQAKEILKDSPKLEYINADGVKSELPMTFDGFLDGNERTMVILK